MIPFYWNDLPTKFRKEKRPGISSWPPFIRSFERLTARGSLISFVKVSYRLPSRCTLPEWQWSVGVAIRVMKPGQ
jgi:hypothetical protein